MKEHIQDEEILDQFDQLGVFTDEEGYESEPLTDLVSEVEERGAAISLREWVAYVLKQARKDERRKGEERVNNKIRYAKGLRNGTAQGHIDAFDYLTKALTNQDNN